MKKQIYELIIVTIFFSLIVIKDTALLNKSKIVVIENTFDKLLDYKLKDYDNLLKINKIKTNYNYKCVTTIKRNATNDFYKYIMLYNNNCNAKSGDLVINEYGLIGIITSKSSKTIKVKQITNPSLKISVNIRNNLGTLKSDKGTLIIDDISSINDINIGNIVYTSDFANIPSNIAVGTVKKISKGRIIVNSFEKIDNPYVIIIGDNR